MYPFMPSRRGISDAGFDLALTLARRKPAFMATLPTPVCNYFQQPFALSCTASKVLYFLTGQLSRRIP